MSYTLNNLGSKNFEHLVQALSKKIIGEGVSIYGAGPDGQREATFYGKAPYPSKEECWDGYWVIQAKFKEPNTKKVDFLWIKDCFEEEMKNFEEKKAAGKAIPDNYLFFTNIVLTPVLEKGIKDKIDEIASQYKKLIPHIHILGADDINRFLEGNRDVAVSYASYILSGDILSYLYKNIQDIEKQRQNAFFRYLVQAFSDDYCSRMEQAGQVTDEKVSIDKVYVDLSFVDKETKNKGEFIKHSISVGNEIFRFSVLESNKQEKSTRLDNEYPISNKYVLRGSAGQGKSTVCQFLAQIYRATFLNNFYDFINPKIREFIDRIKSDGVIIPTCYRVPIRIELRLYSSWMINRQKEGKLSDLITYISSIIAEKASDKFDNETLRLYLGKYSWVFFFDGLDEVPESSNRKDIMDEIERFIENELRQADTDAVFFATTRPEGYVGEFARSNFKHIDLLPLDRSNCFKYLEKLLLALEDDSTKRNGYLEILKQAWDNKQIAFIMRTPLQATIIAILVRAGGEPPRDKYSLFKEYFDIIIKREKQKGMGSILNNNQDLVEGVYYLLGYDLQKRSSTAEGSDALISLDRMKELIKQKLKEDGIETTAPSYKQLLNDTYSMIVNRINFASEIKEGYIGFSIRSMQEFLAAVYIVKTVDDVKLGTLLKDLAQSSYWKNTFIFLVECIAKDKTYYLDHLIDTTLSELNGSELSLNQTNATASVYYGSQVAVTLLSNNIFKNKPKYENKLCKYFTGYCNLQYCDELTQVLIMSDNVKRELTNYLLKKEKLTNADFLLASVLLQDDDCRRLLLDFSNQYASKIVAEYYSHINFDESCPPSLYSLISICINEGEFLELDISQIVDVIKNVEGLNTKKAQANLFKIAIKALLSNYSNNPEQVSILGNFFNCDLEPFINIREYFRKEKSITEYTSVVYPNADINIAQINEIINLANEYSLEGLSLILRTIGSKNIEDYIFFFENITKHTKEIDFLNETVLIQQNKLMGAMWYKVRYDVSKYTKEMLLGENVVASLQNFKKISTFEELVEEQKKEFTIYGMSVTSGDNTFFEFYDQVLKFCSETQIKNSPVLCDIVLFMYSCQYRFEYGEDSKTARLKRLEQYFDKILEYAKADNYHSVFKTHIWCIAFLKMRCKDFSKYSEISFTIAQNQKMLGFPFSFNDDDKEIILNNIVKYISITENRSAFDLLYEFIFDVDFDILIKIDWESLKHLSEPNILCLIELSKAENEQSVIENLIPSITEETRDFVFEIVKTMDMPSFFVPLYVYYLDKYRNENQLKKVLRLEQKICYDITSNPVNI